MILYIKGKYVPSPARYARRARDVFTAPGVHGKLGASGGETRVLAQKKRVPAQSLRFQKKIKRRGRARPGIREFLGYPTEEFNFIDICTRHTNYQ